MKTSFKHSKKVALICGLSFLFSGCTISKDKDINENVIQDNKPTTVITTTPSVDPKGQESNENDKTTETLRVEGTMPEDYKFELNGDKAKFINKDMSFEYPIQWIASREPDFWDASSEREASPEQGVVLYIDKNNNEKVSVYSSESTWDDAFESNKAEQGFEKSTYQAENGVIWNVLTGRQNDKKSVVYGINDENNYYGYIAEVSLSEDNFSKYENDILKVLESFKIEKSEN